MVNGQKSEGVLGSVHAFVAAILILDTFADGTPISQKLHALDKLAIYGLAVALLAVWQWSKEACVTTVTSIWDFVERIREPLRNRRTPTAKTDLAKKSKTHL